MTPFLTIQNSQGRDVGAISFAKPTTSPWVSLLAGVAQAVGIPSGAKSVRFSYDIGSANVYVSPDAITIPSAGSTEISRAETNPLVRSIGDLIDEGITTLNLVSDGNTTIHLYFYSS